MGVPDCLGAGRGTDERSSPHGQSTATGFEGFLMALGMGFRCPAPKNPSSTTLPINTATRALGKDKWDALWKGCSRISPCSLRAPRVKSPLPRAKSFSCTNKSGLLPRAAALHHPRVAVHHLCHRDELRGPRRHITCAEYFMGERTASWLGHA